ncbi:reverse transcriptase domain-containing protein [Tanacetum coccineum]
MVLASDRTQVVIKEVEEWTSAGIVHPVRYPIWISNLVLVKKNDGSWRMCIDFKNINSACPKDYYPMLDIDEKIESVIGRNLEAYMDDMVIKSNDERVLIEDIAEIFDNLRRINMKFNPKKCSFGVEEGKFIGLSGKLAALKRFLSRSAEKSLPFFETLKDITKGNKDEYRWTESAKKAFQEMKKVIVELPLLTTPIKEETLYVYIAAAPEAVSAVLLAERQGKQCLIHYVSRTLNEAERNYALLEKLALSLLHMSRRLRRYFEAHPIKVIMDQPLKQILNKAQASGKLAKYLVELGAYNIAYKPRSAMKVQVLADFLSEALTETPTDEFFRLPAKLPNKDDVEKWTLFTDRASNSKGSRAGLVLISPSSVKFTYALRLNFTSTNNEAEYEALLAGLHMARKMKVLAEQSTNQKEVRAIIEEKEDNWMTPIIRCLAEGVWPEDKDEKRALRIKINQYVLEEGVLFKNGYLVPMLRCVGPLQANYVIREIHMGSCGMHNRARSVVAKAIRQGYYLPTMHKDVRNVTQKCDSCQVHAPVPRRPKMLMTSIMAPWIFYQ